MSEALNRCCSRFKEEIHAAEHCLAQVGDHLASASQKSVDTLEVELKKASEKCEAQRQHATRAGERTREFLEEVKDNAVDRFEDWKANREIEKIEKHADKKEQRAVDAIMVAAFALLEAEVAVVDALKARKTAIEIAG